MQCLEVIGLAVMDICRLCCKVYLPMAAYILGKAHRRPQSTMKQWPVSRLFPKQAKDTAVSLGACQQPCLGHLVKLLGELVCLPVGSSRLRHGLLPVHLGLAQVLDGGCQLLCRQTEQPLWTVLAACKLDYRPATIELTQARCWHSFACHEATPLPAGIQSPAESS